MDIKSVDIKGIANVIPEIEKLEKPEDILAFIDGDTRKGVLAVADERLKELGHEGLKIGQVEKITDSLAEFKKDPMVTKQITIHGDKPVYQYYKDGKFLGQETPDVDAGE